MRRGLFKLFWFTFAFFCLPEVYLCGQAQTAPQVPVSFFGAGMSALTSTRPEPAGWFVYGQQLSATQKVYTAIETDYSLVKAPSPASGYQVMTSARSDIGTYLRNYGPFGLYVLGGLGAATTGNASGAAVSGNALVIFPLRKNGLWYGAVSYKLLQTSVNGTTHQVNVGFLKVAQ